MLKLSTGADGYELKVAGGKLKVTGKCGSGANSRVHTCAQRTAVDLLLGWEVETQPGQWQLSQCPPYDLQSLTVRLACRLWSVDRWEETLTLV